MKFILLLIPTNETNQTVSDVETNFYLSRSSKNQTYSSKIKIPKTKFLFLKLAPAFFILKSAIKKFKDESNIGEIIKQTKQLHQIT